jgi:hypothetical protein
LQESTLHGDCPLQLDVTGRYFTWTSNTGGDRLDAFVVKLPALLGFN